MKKVKKKAKVGQWSTDPKTLKELEDEDNVSLEKDFRKEKAREKENAKYAKVGTLEEFKLKKEELIPKTTVMHYAMVRPPKEE